MNSNTINDETNKLNSSVITTVVFPIALIMLGCGFNNFILEMIVKYDSGSGNLITLGQFAFIAIEGLVHHLELKPNSIGLKKRTIPIYYFCLLVAVFFTLSILNNKAFDFRISLPLHMIFRSGSLAMNLIIGVLFFQKKHTLSEYLSVASVTVGIFAATYLSTPKSSQNDTENVALTEQMIGIGILSVALVLSSLLGHLQEWAYRNYGKDWRENMFYTHLLALPLFLTMATDIGKHVDRFNQSPPYNILGMGSIPSMWILLAANFLSQYVCIRGVYSLTGNTSSLTMTLVITLRKFCSLVFSVLYFKNDFTPLHWLASFLVFGGSIVYTLVRSQKKEVPSSKKE